MISEAAAVLAERRQPQQPRGRALAWMAFSTLVRRARSTPSDHAQGIVYGDLGTSPICALRLRRPSLSFADALQGIFAADQGVPAPEDVVGAISAIVWSLTIVAAIKYAIVRPPFAPTQVDRRRSRSSSDQARARAAVSRSSLRSTRRRPMTTRPRPSSTGPTRTASPSSAPARATMSRSRSASRRRCRSCGCSRDRASSGRCVRRRACIRADPRQSSSRSSARA